MQPPPDPEGDVPSSAWAAFALEVGLRLAGTFGLGLTLFNALRTRFEGVEASILGDIASTIGAAVRAATGLSSEQLNQSIPLGDLPTVPASFHQNDPGDRVVAAVSISGNPVTGEAGPAMRTWVSGLEDMTPQELMDLAQSLYEQALDDTPRGAADLRAQAQYLEFLAKYY